jgi:acylphosphatase
LSATPQAIRLVMRGRVQGVGFRAFVVREARQRGVRGWVRNRRDGTVEALLIGSGDALGAMEVACRRGPSLARVSEVGRHPAQDDGSTDFREQPTI